MTKREEDQRVVRTRAALVDSFNELVLQGTFDSVNVGDVAADAGVGRSTFYEHFRNKDELLLQASAGVMGVLADAVLDEAGRARALAAAGASGAHWRTIEQVLEHVRENRVFARSLLSGTTLDAITRQLCGLIEQRLVEMGAGAAGSVGARVTAAQIGGALLAGMKMWLEEIGPCAAGELAEAMRRAARAMAAAGREGR